LNTFPDLEHFPLSPCPVDIIAQQLSAIIFRTTTDCCSDEPRIFHLANVEPISMSNIFQQDGIIGNHLSSAPLSDWFEMVRSQLKPEDPLIPLISVWEEESQQMERFGWTHQLWSTDQTNDVLVKLGINSSPSELSFYLRRHVEFIFSKFVASSFHH
jgi:hypothetical protein